MRFSNFTLSIFLSLFFFTNTPMAQVLKSVTPPKNNSKAVQQLKNIKQHIHDEFKNRRIRPCFPIQTGYYLPVKNSSNKAAVSIADSTPPSAPSNLVISIESVQNFFVSWTASQDAESGIDYYAYAIGSQPGESDLRYWQSTGTTTRSYSNSLEELGLAEGATVFISVYALNGAGLQSETATSDAIKLEWRDFGLQEYELTVAFSTLGYDSTGSNIIAGWSQQQVDTLSHFVSLMVPIIKEIYGPPSRDYTVSLVKNLSYSGSNIFFPTLNEIHMSDFYPQLLTHELLHAFRDNVILSTDDNWQYDPQLSGFEESFAQGVSYICMNRYIALYPADYIADSSNLFGSSMHWDYDIRNTPAITTEDFWSDDGGMGIFWARYELGAAAMRKIHLEDADFFRKFNAAYYARLNADHSLTTSRDLMIDIIADILPSVENQPTRDWLNKQRIFDCTIKSGRKIWVRTQHYPWEEFIIFQRIFYYETFSNGSEWSHWDNNIGDWSYHNLNGSSGVGTVSTYNDSTIWQGNLLIEPMDNPPDFFGFGLEEFNFSTDDDLAPWPFGDTSDYLLGMHHLSLYQFDITFDTTSLKIHRLIGDELKNTTGVFGGIQNSQDGLIYLNHENYPDEPPLQVVDGAFWGPRQWASVPNPLTGGTDSQPGKISVKFVQNDGKIYLAQRNIDWGSWNGNQAFLFNTNEMRLDTTTITTVEIYTPPLHFELHQSYPNPFNPSTEIQYTLPQSGKVEVSIHNLLGQKLKTLVSETQEAGEYKIIWDSTNSSGLPVGSGTYFCVIEANGKRLTGKMLLLR